MDGFTSCLSTASITYSTRMMMMMMMTNSYLMSDVDDSHTFAMQDIPNQRPPVLKKKKKVDIQ